MPLIKTIEPNEATGKVKEIYAFMEKLRGKVGNNAKLFSSSPELLQQQVDFILYYMNHKAISSELSTAVRLLVSYKNGCEYCVDLNTMIFIKMLGWDAQDVQSLIEDLDASRLQPKDKAMLSLVLKSVFEANDVNSDDIEKLKELGYEDSDILDAINLGARMSAVNIIFNSLKIEKEK